MQRMANQKCPKAVKKFTGDQTYFPTSTPSDHQTYVTMVWDASKTEEISLIASEFFDRFRTFLICHALHLSNCSNHRCIFLLLRRLFLI
jgi:hypothetical protein